MDFLQLLFPPKGLLPARGSHGLEAIGRAQAGHKFRALSPSANLEKSRRMTMCFFLGFVHLLSRKLFLNKNTHFGFCGSLLGATPGCTWKNITQPIPRKAMKQLPTLGNNQIQPFKRALYYFAGLQRACNSTCKLWQMVLASTSSLHHPIIWFSRHCIQHSPAFGTARFCRRQSSTSSCPALTCSEPQISLYYGFHFYLLQQPINL